MPECTSARQQRYRRGLAISCTCRHCGAEFRPKERTRVTYCSRECCHAHWKVAGDQGRKDRGRMRKADVIALRRFRSVQHCQQCGVTFASDGRLFCSDQCRSENVDQSTARRRFKPTECHHCGAAITPHKRRGRPRQYCTIRCQRRWWSEHQRPQAKEWHRDHKKRRRARKLAAPVERFTSRSIYERDAWCCGICGNPTDRDASVPHPLAPTLDHITALARGGHHTRDNVRCAHFSCNSRKGAA